MLAWSAQSPMANMSGSEVRPCSSTATPLPPSAPAARSGSTAGMMPIPTITISAGVRPPPAHRPPPPRPAPVLALDLLDHRAEPDVDAMRAVLGLVEARQRLAGDARQNALERFKHSHPLAELGEHRRRLQPDIA